jgi:uncharacterized protein YrrD
MKISKKQYVHVTVETESGDTLGKLIDFDLETDTGIVEVYHVKNSQGITGLFGDEFLISKEQVIFFDETKMIVKDEVVKADEQEVTRVSGLSDTSPAITSNS